MTDDTCTACHDRPRDGDTYLCQSCADDFHAHIAELPALAKELETGHIYSEEDLNGVLLRFHEDYCTLRRDMIAEGLLKREKGRYEKV